MKKLKFSIVLCTYNPHPDFLRKQVESIKKQTCGDWVCIVSDDASEEERFQQVLESVSADSRFVVTRNLYRLGVVKNFEFALGRVPSNSQYVCYCDQDDVWKPEKLQRQAQVFEKVDEVGLCHSDMEVIDGNDRLLTASYFDVSRKNLSDYSLSSLIMNNSVTGCTMAFRRRYLDVILPIPSVRLERPFPWHDLWSALMICQRGAVYVERTPLVAYRRHGHNVIGPQIPRCRARGTSWNRTRFKKIRTLNREGWQLRRDLIFQLPRRAIDGPELRKLLVWARNDRVDLSLLGSVLRAFVYDDPNKIKIFQFALGKVLN